MGLTAAEEAFASIRRDLHAFAERMQADVEARTEPTVEAWCERLREQAEYTEMGFAILARFTEYRRAYGGWADSATVNRVQMQLDGAMSRLPKLMALTAEGIEALHAERVAQLNRRIAQLAEREAFPMVELLDDPDHIREHGEEALRQHMDRIGGSWDEGYSGVDAEKLYAEAQQTDPWPGEEVPPYRGTSWMDAPASLTPTEDASHPDDLVEDPMDEYGDGLNQVITGEPPEPSHPDELGPQRYANGHLVGCHYDCRIPDCGCVGDCTHDCMRPGKR